ncbi:MAG: phosphatidate cytidylyltransferase [Acidobacteriota bacterium]|jgi:phosphatidate cytidylyltransferase|nr:phosphatidate cytidylyltransferase [Acidobacteriota bacterium]
MKRTLSALVLVPVAILVVVYAPPAVYLVGVGVLGSLCLHEYFGLMKNMGVRVRPAFGFAAFWFLLVALQPAPPALPWLASRHEGLPLPALLAVLVAAFLVNMWRPALPVRDRAQALLADALGVFYFAIFLSPVVAVRYGFDAPADAPVGMPWTVTLLAAVWAGDTGALAVGKTWGRTPFAPLLSPKKSYEGAAGGLLAGVLVAAVLQRFLFPVLPLGHVVAVAALAGVFGQLGDLGESMLKRAAEVKDSSRLIPGHGGALDRMDSLLFAFPMLYVYLFFLYR